MFLAPNIAGGFFRFRVIFFDPVRIDFIVFQV
jgi:hypothetical protein